MRDQSDADSLADRWFDGDPAAVFGAVANETRLEALIAIFEADGRYAAFSEIEARVSIRDSGNLAYHLDELTGRFVDRAEGAGYALRPAAYYVLLVLRTNALDGDVDPVAGTIDDPCPYCSAPLRFAYGADQRARIECDGCQTTFRRRSMVPPAAIEGRDPDEAAAVVDAAVRADLHQRTAGVCPNCRGRVRSRLLPASELAETVRAYDRDASDGAHVEFECEHCTAASVVPASLLLYELDEAAAFFAAHGRRLGSLPVWTVAAWNDDDRAAVTDDGRLEFSMTVEDETFTATFDARARPIRTERIRSFEG